MKSIIIICLTFCLFAFTQGDTHNWEQKAYYGGGNIFSATSFTVGDYAYVGAGCNSITHSSSGYKKFLYRYDPSLDVWKRMIDLPNSAESRSDAIGFSIEGKGYVCGGKKWVLATLYQSMLSDVWEYNPETNLWYQRTSFPRQIKQGICFSIGSKAYVGLGLKGVTDPSGGFECTPDIMNDFYEFDPIKNKWTQLKDFPGAPRYDCIGFSMNGKGYVGLGHTDMYRDPEITFKDFWEYDPSTDNWTRLPDIPGEGRGHAIGFGVDGCCYVGMGSINDFYKYDLSKREWTSLNYLPGGARNSSYSFCVGSNIYYGGGFEIAGSMQSDLWKYSTTNVMALTTSEKLKFKCYPNPTNDQLTIEMSGNHPMSRLKLTDMDGKVIYENNRSLGSMAILDLSPFKKGNYLLIIEDKKGMLLTEKIVKN